MHYFEGEKCMFFIKIVPKKYVSIPKYALKLKLCVCKRCENKFRLFQSVCRETGN